MSALEREQRYRDRDGDRMKTWRPEHSSCKQQAVRLVVVNTVFEEQILKNRDLLEVPLCGDTE